MSPSKHPDNFRKPLEQVPARVNDLVVLTVQFPPMQAYPHAAKHYLYIRPDEPKDAAEVSEDNRRSLFVGNVPVTASTGELRALFKSLASTAVVDHVEFAAEARKPRLAVTGDVMIQGTKVGVPIGVISGRAGRKRKRDAAGLGDEDEIVRERLEAMEVPSTWDRNVWGSGESAVVTFVDRDAMGAGWKAVLKAAKEGRKVKWPAVEEGLGIERYKAHHALTYPSPAVLQQKVNAYLTHFSTLESLRAKQLARQRNVPDEDGFIIVSRGGRTGAGRREDAEAAQERLAERAKKRIGDDFYRFQTREARKRREGELKRKFAEDRKKVESMRQARGKVVPE